ncbi:MAG: hypothetical protein M5R42_20850 [Rhodocyclaceae bacterium]|nr:hypothetical protein [Rhodocyclaceae bacterium]
MEDKEPFLSRWARLKRAEAGQASETSAVASPTVVATDTAAEELPPSKLSISPAISPASFNRRWKSR